MFERHTQPLVSRKIFARRMALSVAAAGALLVVALGVGVLGYHFVGQLAWIDALLNASMILAGMGPVDPLKEAAGKLFASAYAVFSGITFPTVIAIMLAPVAHRFLHHLHLEVSSKEKD